MDFDRPARAPAAGAAAAQHAMTPGKRTLIETLAVQRREPDAAPAAQLAVRGTEASAPAPRSAGSSPRSTLQMLFGIQRAAAAASTEDPAQVHAAAVRGTATPASTLPHADQIQRLFGRHDISRIQAHSGADAAASAREMGATAYATGDHVVLGANADLHTVAHEAAHVIQQRGGVQLKGGVGGAGDEHERHADAVADRVSAGESAEDLLDRYASSGGQTASVQLVRDEDRQAVTDRWNRWQDKFRGIGAWEAVFINGNAYGGNIAIVLRQAMQEDTLKEATDLIDKELQPLYRHHQTQAPVRNNNNGPGVQDDDYNIFDQKTIPDEYRTMLMQGSDDLEDKRKLRRQREAEPFDLSSSMREGYRFTFSGDSARRHCKSYVEQLGFPQGIGSMAEMKDDLLAAAVRAIQQKTLGSKGYGSKARVRGTYVTWHLIIEPETYAYDIVHADPEGVY